MLNVMQISLYFGYMYTKYHSLWFIIWIHSLHLLQRHLIYHQLSRLVFVQAETVVTKFLLWNILFRISLIKREQHKKHLQILQQRTTVWVPLVKLCSLLSSLQRLWDSDLCRLINSSEIPGGIIYRQLTVTFLRFLTLFH